jgi:hypothetical protein
MPQTNLQTKLGVKINRRAPVRLLPFSDYFKGFEKVEAVRVLFGNRTEKVLNRLRVEFFSSRFGYMGVSDADGHLLVSTHHLKNSGFRTLYLDVVHELHHVKQFMDGRKLFNNRFEYVDNPTEVEAYRATVKEAKRIGMTNKEIIDYLKVEWNTPEQQRRLVKKMGLKA